jgi:hypothetical protein
VRFDVSTWEEAEAAVEMVRRWVDARPPLPLEWVVLSTSSSDALHFAGPFTEDECAEVMENALQEMVPVRMKRPKP